MKIVASSPGDIVIEFKIPSGVEGENKTYLIPVKSLSAQKSMESSKEYGVGSHQAYAEVVGKIAYEGDFTIGTWYTSAEDNPEVWDRLVTLLTYQNDEGLPREFTINIHARGGAGMQRVGTGVYTGGETNSTMEDTVSEGNVSYYNNESSGSTSDKMIIMSYYRCILKGDSIDIPEVGGTVSRKYPFSSLFRIPK